MATSRQASRCSTRPILRAGAASTASRKLAPRLRGEEPGHVRGRGRQHPHDVLCGPRRRLRTAAGSRRCGSPSRSALWLWFTVLFANFAEAMAEGRGKAQADDAAQDAQGDRARRRLVPRRSREEPSSPPPQLRKGDLRRGRGRADSSPATARSSKASPRSTSGPSPASPRPSSARAAATAAAVTGGTQVLSDRIVVRITAEPGRVVPRPDDRAGRGRRAAEDAQRDRAAHPPRRR